MSKDTVDVATVGLACFLPLQLEIPGAAKLLIQELRAMRVGLQVLLNRAEGKM